MATGDDNYSGMLATLAGVQGVGNLVSGWAQAQALTAQADFASSMAKINQQYAQMRGDQIIQSGNEQADKLRQQGLKVQGAQRSAAASQNIRSDDGSAGEAVTQTRELSADDQITMKTNAWREAFGVETQSKLNADQAQFQRSGAKMAAASTLLSGAIGAVGNFEKVGKYLSTSKLPVQTPGVTTPKSATTSSNPEFEQWFGKTFGAQDIPDASKFAFGTYDVNEE